MNGLFFVFVIIAWIVAAVKKSNAKQQKRSMGTPVPPAFQPAAQPAAARPAMLSDMLSPPAFPQEGEDPCHPDGNSTQRGSMSELSPEGVDPCHPPLERESLRDRQRITHRLQVIAEDEEEQEQQEAAFTADFSPEGMRQAIIMNEILTRPGKRRRVHS